MILCSILFFLYALGGLAFALVPKTTVSLINHIGECLFGLKPAPLPESAFFSALAAGMMATIASCMAMVLKNPGGNRSFLIPVVAEKCASSGLGALYFLLLDPNAAYLTLFVVDFPLALLTVFLYRVKLR